MSDSIQKIKIMIQKISQDNITSYAAQSCFYITLSFFPFLLLLMNLLRLFSLENDFLYELFRSLAPAQLEPWIYGMISDISNAPDVALLSATSIGTLWAAGKGFLAIIHAMNMIYAAPSRKNWFINRFLSIFYTIVLITSIALTMLILLFGKELATILMPIFPNLSRTLIAILSHKTFIFPAALIFLFISLYKHIPNRSSSICKEFPGALFAALGWYAFSNIYSLYVTFSPNYNYLYGSLTTQVFAMIWLYICMIILFLGAELNALLAQGILKRSTIR